MAAPEAAALNEPQQPASRISFVVSGTTLHSPKLHEGTSIRSFKELRELHSEAVWALGGALAQGSAPYFSPAFSWQSVHTIRDRQVTELDHQLDGLGLVLLDAAAWGSVSCPSCKSDASPSWSSSWSPAASLVSPRSSVAVHTWFVAAKRRTCGGCKHQWTDRVDDLPLAIIRLLPEPLQASRNQQASLGPKSRLARDEPQQQQQPKTQVTAPVAADAAEREEIVIADSPPRPAQQQQQQQASAQPKQASTSAQQQTSAQPKQASTSAVRQASAQPKQEQGDGMDSDAVGTLLLLGGPTKRQEAPGVTGEPTAASAAQVAQDDDAVDSPLKPPARPAPQPRGQQDIMAVAGASKPHLQHPPVVEQQAVPKPKLVTARTTSGPRVTRQPHPILEAAGAAADDPDASASVGAAACNNIGDVLEHGWGRAAKRPRTPGKGLTQRAPQEAFDAAPQAPQHESLEMAHHNLPAQPSMEIVTDQDEPAQQGLKAGTRKQVQAGAKTPRKQKPGARQPITSEPDPAELEEAPPGPLALVGHVSDVAQQAQRLQQKPQQKSQQAHRLQHVRQFQQQQQVLPMLATYGPGYHQLLPHAALGLGWQPYLLPPYQQQQQPILLGHGHPTEQHSHQSTIEQLGATVDSDASGAQPCICKACLLLLNQVWAATDPHHMTGCFASQLVPHSEALVAAAEAQAREEIGLRPGSAFDSMRYIKKYRSKIQIMSAGVMIG